MTNKKEEEIYLAQETLDKYKSEYHELVNVKRPEVQAALKEARAQGDLSENAEYDAAREMQGIVEARIRELEAIIERAVVITNDESRSSSKIGVGATVTYEKVDTKEIKTVTIMGIHDSDPLNGKISNESALALALADGKVGQIVEVDAITKYNIKIIDVEYK
ncbi:MULTISPECIES: transcription elongation factor GreA [Mycoplasma]|uniref:Transcription elongation factor GreA n=1 Tax=Mycoplasma miroungigenitalium TaxID=754515 RepID=A0A6M4JB64_9MOLU|nr:MULTISPECIES: transcription elongation factor GreA [Mycoplasma]MBU4690215.1 transcription elongation factor GreA [Mycoplasma miroungigenitalium]MBU4691484.1 transcription elongation factor GreA [Mycoplasma miroungigenitalium]MCR8966736.1 transcription elongation factor GreA [Mycoplasma zalophidermidis]QJR43319.1 transcription elongation factor GreA [Mycoplasma miroungigenitalium]